MITEHDKILDVLDVALSDLELHNDLKFVKFEFIPAWLTDPLSQESKLVITIQGKPREEMR
jgi:hypothetical protein